MIQNIETKQSNKYLECIMGQSILIIITLTLTTSYSLFIDKEQYNLEYIASLGFWINLTFCLYRKMGYKKQIQEIELIQKNSEILDFSLLSICYIIILPLFFYSYFNSTEGIQKLGLPSLISVLSFCACSLFTLLKNESIQSISLNISNSFLIQAFKVAYFIYSKLLITSFLIINSSLTSHAKFIFSYFTFSLFFLGAFRFFKLKIIGFNFQAAISATVFVISWNKVDTNRDEQPILKAYTFLLYISMTCLIYLFAKFYHYLFSYPKIQNQIQSELPISNQQESNRENINNTENSIAFQTGHNQIYQIFLQQFQRVIAEKELQIMKNLTTEQLENVLQTIPYSHPQQSSQIDTNEQHNKSQQVQDGCSICQLDFENGQKLFQLSCNHKYHIGCLSDWLKHKNNCPLCRNSVLTTYQMAKAVDFDLFQQS